MKRNFVAKYASMFNKAYVMPNEKKEALDRWIVADYASSCEIDGHNPELLGTAPDGTAFYKCKECDYPWEE